MSLSISMNSSRVTLPAENILTDRLDETILSQIITRLQADLRVKDDESDEPKAHEKKPSTKRLCLYCFKVGCDQFNW